MSTNHSPACLELRSKELAEREAFLKLFPGACQKCNATGLVSYLEHHEFWGAACAEELSEDCPECLALSKCPRCGDSAKFYCDDPDTLKCFNCDWTPESPALPELVDDFDCSCFDEELERQIEENKRLRTLEMVFLVTGLDMSL